MNATQLELFPIITIMFWRGAFAKDDFARMCDRAQPIPYLFTGRVPALDQRVEIMVTPTQFESARMSGIVTGLGPAPSNEEFLAMNDPPSLMIHAGRDEVIATYGALHGQTVQVRCILSPDYYRTPFLEICGEHKVWEVALKCNDNMGCMWVVSGDPVLVSEDVEAADAFKASMGW